MYIHVHICTYMYIYVYICIQYVSLRPRTADFHSVNETKGRLERMRQENQLHHVMRTFRSFPPISLQRSNIIIRAKKVLFTREGTLSSVPSLYYDVWNILEFQECPR